MWSVVGVPDTQTRLSLWYQRARVYDATGWRCTYVGVCVYEACGFVCGVGELLGWYGAYARHATKQADTLAT